ncbi:hypothetical protein JCM10207_000738 [Rhodosporidiobolus poonsookiae]
MKARDSMPASTRPLFFAGAVALVGLVLLVCLAATNSHNPLASFDWEVVASKVAETPSKLFFQPSASTRLNTCGISSDLLDEFGKHNFRLSQVHVGSGYRMQKVLAKAQRGEQIRIGVLGGSVSLGHGASPKTGRLNTYGAVPYDEQWHQFVRRFFTDIAGVEPEFKLGAKAATDSTFFEWCWSEMIGTDLDLILVEMAVNDEYATGMDSSENLLRSLLQLESQPAVLYADTFALRSGSTTQSMLNGQDVQNSLASFYDVAQISARPALLPAMISDHSLAKPLFLGDARHGGTKLHRFLGSMIVGYLEEETCRMQEAVADEQRKQKRGLERDDGWVWPSRDSLGKVPKVKMNERWDADVSHATKPPMCRTAGANLEPVAESKDWVLFNWKYSKYYYETKVPDSEEIVFEAEVKDGARGILAVSFLRSRQYDLGKARCTVGGQSAVLDGYWAVSTSLAQTAVVAKDLPAGMHRVSCRTLPEEKGGTGTAFRLMGVMTV